MFNYVLSAESLLYVFAACNIASSMVAWHYLNLYTRLRADMEEGFRAKDVDPEAAARTEIAATLRQRAIEKARTFNDPKAGVATIKELLRQAREMTSSEPDHAGQCGVTGLVSGDRDQVSCSKCLNVC